jgi:hypothetical protein
VTAAPDRDELATPVNLDGVSPWPPGDVRPKWAAGPLVYGKRPGRSSEDLDVNVSWIGLGAASEFRLGALALVGTSWSGVWPSWIPVACGSW